MAASIALAQATKSDVAALPAAAISSYALVISDPSTLRLQDKLIYQLTAPYAPIAKPAKLYGIEKTANTEAVNPRLAEKPYAKEIESASRNAELDVALVHALIYVESRHRQNALSPKGAVGLMQVLPTTAARYGVNNPNQSAQANLKAGTAYLRYLMSLFDQNLDLVLAAYNAGEGAVLNHARKIPPYRETQAYVRAVRAKYEEFSGTLLDEKSTETSVGKPRTLDSTPFTEYLAGTRLEERLPVRGELLVY